MRHRNDYEARRAANNRSRSWAKHQGDLWTPYDSAYILDQWVFKPGSRDVEAVSRHLGRTIESCRMHAEQLRAELGIQVNDHFTRSVEEPLAEPCPRCYIVPAANGSCLC